MSNHDWQAYYRLKPGDTFIEVGAYYGDDILPVFEAIGLTGTAIFIEPNLRACTRMRKMIRDLDNFVVVNQALWSTEAKVGYHCDGKATSYVTSLNEGGELVSATTLDKVVRLFGPVNLLAVDVEGSEYEVLMGGINSLKSGAIKNISVAAYHRYDDRTVIPALLKTFNTWTFNESGSYEVVTHASLQSM